MVRILQIFLWSKNIITSQHTYLSPFWLLGAILLTGCGVGGGDDFRCQGLGGNTVSGTVRYEKKLYDQNGFTGRSIYLPVRFATVDVNSPSGLLATTTTDSQGRYCAIYIKTGNLTENRVSVVSKTSIPTLNIQVGFFFGVVLPDDQVEFRFTQYAFSSTFDERQGGSEFTVDLNMPAGKPGSGSNPGGVFNIIDTLARGSEFFRTMRGEVPPLVTAVWQDEIGGTFFITEEQCKQAGTGVSGDCIFVQGDGEVFFDEVLGGDRDEYDDDILLHEYGHFIAHNFSRDSSPGGIHFLNDHTQDIRLSFSEGWATFFSSAVRNDPVNVDVSITGEALFAFSIESNSLLYPPIIPEPLKRSAVYTTSEIAVASVLWDIFDRSKPDDPPEEARFDNLSLGFGPIWDILNFWHQSLQPVIITQEAFWDSFGQIMPEFVPQVLGITEEREMEFSADDCEVSNTCNRSVINKSDDNSPNNATSIAVNEASPQHHNLFPAGDTDYISFLPEAGKPYTIETLHLTNGADTYLEILYHNTSGVLSPLLDTTGKPYANDNPGDQVFGEGCAQLRQDPDGMYISDCPNNETALASKVVVTNFTPPVDCASPCALYARVTRSPNAPPSTGRYGSYDFRVASP